MTDRHAIVACARQLIGVRFAPQGRSVSGLDCLGLLLATATRAGLRFEQKPVASLDVVSYGMRPDTALLQAKLDHFLMPIPPVKIEPADILLLRIGGLPQHLAIVSDYPMAGEFGMIHAYAPARKVVEHRYDAAWRRDTHTAYRLPQLS